MPIRKGREFYGAKYEEALRLYEEGLSIKDIAKKLSISYSAAYHWIKGLRKPEKGNVNEFFQFIEKEGPVSAFSAEKKFPKHNELFLMASRRSLPMKRVYLGKKYKELATWYFVPGQESELEKRLESLFSDIEDARNKLKSILFKE